VSLEVAQDLQGSVITLAVNLSAGQEFNAANNVTSKTFDTLNHVPMITFVSPAADEAFGAQYEIRWTASDEDGDPLSVDIYVDSDTEPVNGRSLVAAGQPNTGSYLLNTSLLTDGTYYISITVSDGKRGSATGYSLGRIGNEDMDGDGARDSEDNCIETPNPDQRDSDGDGVGDACDPFPNDKNEWLDSDGDGVGDKGDGCPNDPNKLSPQRCGCGKAETDSDGDGVPDCVDPFPNDKNEWMDSDGDGIGDNADLDDDNDGMPDAWEILHGLNPRNAADAAGDRDGDGLSNLEEYEQGRDPNNKPPQKPVLLSPADGEQDVALTPKLETDAFQDQDPGDSHALTEWEISAVEGDFSESALVFRLESGTYLTSFVVPEAILDLNRTYFWRVRFQDSKGEPSEWSEAASFVTVTVDENDQDGNGTPDEQEVDDRKLDLDADGIPDITEPDMACVKTALGNQKIALSGVTNVVSIDYVKSVDPADIPGTGKKPHQFPWGVISFRVAVDHPGDTAKVIVYLPHPASPNARWYKYDVINGWQDYSDHVTFGGKRKSVILELTDGGDGDTDGVANGVIVDPSGVGEPAASVASSQGGGGGCFVGALGDASPAAGYVLLLLSLGTLVIVMRGKLRA
jgi:hypothetical protein